MNLVFWFLVFGAVFILWIAFSGLFQLFGTAIHTIYEEIKNIMKQ